MGCVRRSSFLWRGEGGGDSVRFVRRSRFYGGKPDGWVGAGRECIHLVHSLSLSLSGMAIWYSSIRVV